MYQFRILVNQSVILLSLLGYVACFSNVHAMMDGDDPSSAPASNKRENISEGSSVGPTEKKEKEKEREDAKDSANNQSEQKNLEGPGGSKHSLSMQDLEPNIRALLRLEPSNILRLLTIITEEQKGLVSPWSSEDRFLELLDKKGLDPEEIDKMFLEVTPTELATIVYCGDRIRHLRLVNPEESTTKDSSNVLRSCFGLPDPEKDKDYVTNHTLSLLKHFPNLISLDISHSKKITDPGFRYLSGLMHLELLVSYQCPNITDAGIKRLNETPLSRLYLGGCPNITNEGVWFIVQKCPNLTALSLNNTKATHEVIKAISENYSDKLVELELEGCASIADASVQFLTEKCPNLTKLYLGRTRITNVSITNLVRCCKNLSSLALDHTRLSDDALLCLDGLPQLEELWLPKGTKLEGKAIKEHMNYLEFVKYLAKNNITVGDISKLSLNVHPSGLQSLARYGSHILNLSLTKETKDDDLKYLVHFPNLLTLNLTECGNLSKSGFSHLLSLPKLRTLHLPNLPDRAKLEGEDLKRYLHSLKPARSSGAGSSRGSSSQNPTQQRQKETSREKEKEKETASKQDEGTLREFLMRQGKRLEDLSQQPIKVSASELGFLSECEDRVMHLKLISSKSSPITDDILSKSLKKFINLQKLSLDGCLYVTGEGLQSLPKTLTELHLNNCKNISSDALRYLNGVFLTKLTLRGCEKIQDTSLHYLPRTVIHLDLAECPDISDDGIQYICENFPNLRTLHLGKCLKVTNVGPNCLEVLHGLEVLGLPDGSYKRGEDLTGYLKSLGSIKNTASSSKDATSEPIGTASESKQEQQGEAKGESVEAESSLKDDDKEKQKDTVATVSKPAEVAAGEEEPRAPENIKIAKEDKGKEKKGETAELSEKEFAQFLEKQGRELRDLPKRVVKASPLDLELLSVHEKQIVHLKMINSRDNPVTNEVLNEFLGRFTRLKTLSLQDCPHITDDGLRLLPATLVELELDKTKATDATLELLGEMQLTKLSLRRCKKITDSGLNHLPKTLTQLHLAKCPQITDIGIEYVSQNFSDLEILQLGKCIKVTESGLQCIAKKLFKLKVLGLPNDQYLKANELKDFLGELRNKDLSAN